MNICELFLSIDGEGKRTGFPTVFVRKTGCNLRCSYCDSTYSFKENDNGNFSVTDVMTKIKEVGQGCKSVTFTGGEPLYCKNDKEKAETQDFLNSLSYNGYQVNVETNGSIDLEPWELLVRRNNGFFTMDWKSISSKVSRNMLPKNLSVLDLNDVLKFVVSNIEDLDQMKSVLNMYNPTAQVYVSPVFGNIEAKDIVRYVLDNRLYNVKVQLQLHKYIWPSESKGV